MIDFPMRTPLRIFQPAMFDMIGRAAFFLGSCLAAKPSSFRNFSEMWSRQAKHIAALKKV
jgi:hypothetical protein